MNKEKILEISKSLKFKATDKVVEEILKIYEDLSIKIKKMQKINTDNIEPMVRIDDNPIMFMREDNPGPAMDRNIIFSNAPSIEEEFITIPKGEKND